MWFEMIQCPHNNTGDKNNEKNNHSGNHHDACRLHHMITHETP